MTRKKKTGIALFDFIAPIYGLFFSMQTRNFQRTVELAAPYVKLTEQEAILDAGCGTGALCSILAHNYPNLQVTGVDPANKMLKIARRKTAGQDISYLQANILNGLPYADNSFDISISSYVAHGLKSEERAAMYAEMSRITRGYVIIHDYNDKRAPLTSLIEWLERGDYFNFIQTAETEMRNCLSQMRKCFSHVEVIDVGKRASWYICTPAGKDNA